jgi:predicted carbohydrate-binding protein with CBM5 and CBM33 domain
MCRICFAILVLAIMAIASPKSHAAGSFQKPEPRTVVTAGVAPLLPSVTLPEVSAHDLVAAAAEDVSAIRKHAVAVALPISGKAASVGGLIHDSLDNGPRGPWSSRPVR